MKGVIVNYRTARHHQDHNQMVVKVDGCDSKEKAAKLVGKGVIFNTGKKDIAGKITQPHGNSGAVRVHFGQGMPGQSVGKKVELK